MSRSVARLYVVSYLCLPSPCGNIRSTAAELASNYVDMNSSQDDFFGSRWKPLLLRALHAYTSNINTPRKQTLQHCRTRNTLVVAAWTEGEVLLRDDLNFDYALFRSAEQLKSLRKITPVDRVSGTGNQCGRTIGGGRTDRLHPY